ncbi:hypothetical protein HmCmsJML033_03989 [Escherichia coli]|nr:Uncharacterised protein [Escherichia coli]GEE73358.1 hypothetical protein EC142370_04749 [Escherichia coli O145:H34]GCV02119.1 hypothetical protein HmCmsJML039_04641 [Escherichia coli]GCV40734.1 hypothetical protein HmCmsJML033_03989 [Escherichia coli]GDA12403.1 hypothetical protein HmCmsJML163_03549 [Escherichia coli]
MRIIRYIKGIIDNRECDYIKLINNTTYISQKLYFQ